LGGMGNGMQLPEGGDYEAQNFKQAQMMIRSNTVQFTTIPPLLGRRCYRSVHFFFFVRWQSFNHFTLLITLFGSYETLSYICRIIKKEL